MPDLPRLSIIIPVLNEADCLEQSLQRLFAHSWVNRYCEVIVCDGGSRDGSLEIAARYPCHSESSKPGRARQMNHGATLARARHLLFLHADSQLPDDFSDKMQLGPAWGFFRLRLNGAAPVYRVIESAINLRSRITQVAGGDQGLYFERDFFHALGAYPEIPLMEDVAICKAARKRARPGIIDSPVSSSIRRWQNNGVIKTILLMWSLRLAYWLGVNPGRLHRIYYP